MSLRLKIIVGVGLIETLLLIILLASVLSYMRQTSVQQFEDYIASTTHLFSTTIKDAVLSLDLASLNAYTDEILKNKSLLYSRVYDTNNQLLAIGMNSGYTEAPFFVDQSYAVVNDGVFDSETVIAVGDTSYGRIEMGFSTGYIDQENKKVGYLAATIALIEILLIAFFSFLLGVFLTRQLKVLRDAARAVTAGNLDSKININSNDEIGDVAGAFNRMVDSLTQANASSMAYQEELAELNKSLEQRIENRTQKILHQKNELQSAYGQLQQAQRQLVHSEKMASIGQLAAGVAHEINNPIAFIGSNLSALKEYSEVYRQFISLQQCLIESFLEKEKANVLAEKISELKTYRDDNDMDFIDGDIQGLVDDAIYGVQRVSTIANGLREYSRASDDVMEACDVNVCLSDALKIANNQLKYHSDVQTDFLENAICIGNKGKLTQVFTNIMVNAAQAMQSDKVNDKGMLTISTKKYEQYIRASIADTGKGISKKHLSKLFDPFFTTKPEGEGTGLGLSISQGIIDDHGGVITVESEEGKGTLFIIDIPLSE
ncbi:sensor histidine kinase [Eionea flava]